MEFNIFSFPFEQIGWGLRQLSLSGNIGNIFAIIIYLLIGLIPAGGFLLLKKKRKSCAVDIMLLVLSILFYIMMYYMINPGLIVSMVAGAGRMMWGATFYSVLMAYFVIRLLGKNIKTDLNSLQKSLRIVLMFIMLLFVGSVVAEMFVNLPTAWATLAERNTANGFPLDLTFTNVGLALRSIATALPNALSAVAVFLCIKVLEELLKDAYSEQAIAMIKKIVVFCKHSLIVVVAMVMVVNVLQLIFAAQLYDTHIVVAIPVFAVLFLLVIHVMAKYIQENQRLKKDNDLFI